MQTIEGKEGKTDSTAFSKYFDNSDLFELFKCDFSEKCETLDLLLARDGFPIQKTPTNDSHLIFLNSLNEVNGISLNSNLYTKNEGDDIDDSEKLNKKNYK
jgi:hypothetical protein